VTTATVARIVRRTPAFGQLDLRCIHDAAARVLLGRKLAARLDRRLTRAELQLLALCGVVCEMIGGELGTDDLGDPVGDLVLQEQPYLARPKLRPGENGK
jgi:hypothetical protein